MHTVGRVFARIWIPSSKIQIKKPQQIRWLSEQKVPRPEEMSQRPSGRDDPVKGKGPVSWTNLIVSGGCLAAVIGTYQYVKTVKSAEVEKERKREIGKSKIGGPFNLIDHNGTTKTNKDFLGKWSLIYFGFTHCPDVCPDEMEKLSVIYDMIKNSKESFVGDIVPLFITVDPERDTVNAVKEYVKEFHSDFIGLTGTVEQVKEACKSYRVYFSAGPRDDDDDYIVDHTIIIYLVDPDGNFVDYYGQRKKAGEVTQSIKLHMMKFNSGRA